jgi:hypothetical protein
MAKQWTHQQFCIDKLALLLHEYQNVKTDRMDKSIEKVQLLSVSG